MNDALAKKLDQHIGAVLQLETGAVVTKNDDFYGGLLAGLSDRAWGEVFARCREQGIFADMAKGTTGYWCLRLIKQT